MFDKYFLNKLKEKYNYTDKIINALAKIIPSLLQFYGEEHSEIILEAIFNCEIIPCNSYQTISKIKREKELTKFTGEHLIGDIDLKRAEGVYISSPKISYDEINNSYNIDKISRVIVTSHTYNYDSPKGLEVLTYALCKLVKSYYNEYKLEENEIIKRYGISYEKRKIVKDGPNIYLDLFKESGKSLEEGFTIYDAEQIVSMILLDNYEFHDYKTVYAIATILKNKFNLHDEINNCEIYGDYNYFKKMCNDQDTLHVKCDECLLLEDEMFIAPSRKDKDELESKLNRLLSKELFEILNDILVNQRRENIES